METIEELKKVIEDLKIQEQELRKQIAVLDSERDVLVAEIERLRALIK